MNVLSSETLAAILTAYAQNTPIRHIAAAQGMSHRRVRRILQEQGVYRSPVQSCDLARSASAQQRAERDVRILELWERGNSIHAIAGQENVSRETVYKVLHQAGIRLNRAQRVRRDMTKCRCCGIVLSECDDARHEAESVDGLCWDCAEHYVWNGTHWVRRTEYVLEIVPLSRSSDVRMSMAGWSMLEVEE